MADALSRSPPGPPRSSPSTSRTSTWKAAAARSCPRAATSNTSCGARAPRTYCPASSAAVLEDRCSCAAVARYWPAGRRRATSAPTPAGPGSATTAPGSCSTATPHPARASPAGTCTNCATAQPPTSATRASGCNSSSPRPAIAAPAPRWLRQAQRGRRRRGHRTARHRPTPPIARRRRCRTPPRGPPPPCRTSKANSTATPTPQTCRVRADTDRLGPRLQLLREGEATAVAALLDELAGVYTGEDLGELARELAVRIYDRLGI